MTRSTSAPPSAASSPAGGTRWKPPRDGAEALVKLKDFDADVVITDLNMPNLDGKGLLEELQKLASPPPAIVLTAFGNLETALETVHQLGAFWFIEKPLQPQALKMIVERALDRRRLATHAGRLERELASRGVLGDLIGESAVDAGNLRHAAAGGAH